MGKLDPFTVRRLRKFIDEFRRTKAQYPTLRDLDLAGFDNDLMDRAVRDKAVESLYVTLTNGAIIKGFKSRVE